MIKKYLRENLTDQQKHKIKRIISNVLATGVNFNLNKLALIHGTDKNGNHFYTQHYQKHLRKFKFRPIKLLEIGVGGNKNPYLGGHSLRMWKKYFPFAKIYSIDIAEKSFLQEHRIKIFKGSQIDEHFLNDVVNQIGDIDIIIDDGSHMNEHVIKSFQFLFPKLKDGGIYIIEDLQTSYWEHFGGDSHDLSNHKTSMNFLKSLVDSLNYKEFADSEYIPNYYDQNIVSIHFYHNIVFIYKNKNNEKSTKDT
jgi:hypothetical protein